MKTDWKDVRERARKLINKKMKEERVKQLKHKRVNILANVEDKIPNVMIKNRKEVRQKWIN
jgi:hypothetical protein